MSNQTTAAVIVIADNHTHAGKPVAKGDQLLVDTATAAHLVAIKAARLEAATTPKKEPKQ